MSALTHAEGDWRWAASSCRRVARGCPPPAALNPHCSWRPSAISWAITTEEPAMQAPKRGEEGAEQRKGWL